MGVVVERVRILRRSASNLFDQNTWFPIGYNTGRRRHYQWIFSLLAHHGHRTVAIQSLALFTTTTNDTDWLGLSRLPENPNRWQQGWKHPFCDVTLCCFISCRWLYSFDFPQTSTYTTTYSAPSFLCLELFCLFCCSWRDTFSCCRKSFSIHHNNILVNFSSMGTRTHILWESPNTTLIKFY